MTGWPLHCEIMLLVLQLCTALPQTMGRDYSCCWALMGFWGSCHLLPLQDGSPYQQAGQTSAGTLSVNLKFLAQVKSFLLIDI